MSITGIDFNSVTNLESYDDVIETGSATKASEVGEPRRVKGKTDICNGNACVRIDAGEVGLTATQIAAISRSFGDFINKNSGADLTKSGTAVITKTMKGSQDDANLVRVVAQFVGHNLPKGWNSKEARTVIYVGTAPELKVPNSTSGDFSPSWAPKRRPQIEHEIKINMGWKDHRTNPSGVARTLIHEYLHRKDELGNAGGRATTKEHLELDAEARKRLDQYGLSGGGCQPVGDESIASWFLPYFPGCDKK